MGKTADLTTGQKTIIDTLHRMGEPQNFIAKEAGCSQSAVSKHINGKSSGRTECGRRRCTSKRDDRGLQRIIKKRRFKNLAEIQKEWNEAGVTATKTTTFRRIREMGYNCRVPRVKPLLNLSQRRKHLNWAKEKKGWTIGQWSKVTATVYQNVLEDFMIPSAEDLYGDADFLFQQDLAPAHAARSTKAWFDAHAFTVLDWPANSPDLNPIENL
ncbi:hypothetical protein AOLI_G00018500 [Acnodon oligacanthus]